MARSEYRFQVERNGRTEGTFSAVADLDDYGALQEILRSWLDRNRWDTALWHQFRLSTVGPTRRIEVEP